MSWIEDNMDMIYEDEARESWDISSILDELDNKKLDEFNNYLKNNYIELVCSIMSKYKQTGFISDKQKYCIAKFIYENDLQEKLDIGR